MYAEFFGLTQLPFQNTPDPAFFYPTPDHEEAVASMIYTVSQGKGFMLLTGEVGAGKTLVSKLMVRHFRNKVCFATINHTVMSATDLLVSVCTELGTPVPPDASDAMCVRVLHDFLLAQYAHNTPVVLMIDEAQAMSAEGFEQLRMLSNLEDDNAKLLQTLIVGQPELRATFQEPHMRQLRQRVFRAFHLSTLTREQCQGYIQHRLNVAGVGDATIFEPSAIEVIYRHSQGVPRQINTLCDNAMLSAYSADDRTINGDLVESVIAQMLTIGQHPVPRKEPSPVALPAPTDRAGERTQRSHPALDSLADRVKHLEHCERVDSRFDLLSNHVERLQHRLDESIHSTERASDRQLQLNQSTLFGETRDKLAGMERTVDNKFADMERTVDNKLADIARRTDHSLTTALEASEHRVRQLQLNQNTLFGKTRDKLAGMERTVDNKLADIARRTDRSLTTALEASEHRVGRLLKETEGRLTEAARDADKRLTRMTQEAAGLSRQLPDLIAVSTQRDKQMRRLTSIVRRLVENISDKRTSLEHHSPPAESNSHGGDSAPAIDEDNAQNVARSVAAVSQRMKRIVHRTRTSMGDVRSRISDPRPPLASWSPPDGSKTTPRLDSPTGSLVDEVESLSNLVAQL